MQINAKTQRKNSQNVNFMATNPAMNRPNSVNLAMQSTSGLQVGDRAVSSAKHRCFEFGDQHVA